MSKVQLKMVAGKSYASPAFKESTIAKGDTVTVDEGAAKALLEDGFYDPSNNFHHYFKKVVGAPADHSNEDTDSKSDEVGDGEGAGSAQVDEEDPDEGGPHAKQPAAKRARNK